MSPNAIGLVSKQKGNLDAEIDRHRERMAIYTSHGMPEATGSPEIGLGQVLP